MATQRQASKNEYVSQVSIESINSGSLQRIADACEKMAGNYTQLQNDRDLYKRWYNEEKSATAKMRRRVSALQGVITKLKKRKP